MSKLLKLSFSIQNLLPSKMHPLAAGLQGAGLGLLGSAAADWLAEDYNDENIINNPKHIVHKGALLTAAGIPALLGLGTNFALSKEQRWKRRLLASAVGAGAMLGINALRPRY